jgi:hypothetical protein
MEALGAARDLRRGERAVAVAQVAAIAAPNGRTTSRRPSPLTSPLSGPRIEPPDAAEETGRVEHPLPSFSVTKTCPVEMTSVETQVDALVSVDVGRVSSRIRRSRTA